MYFLNFRLKIMPGLTDSTGVKMMWFFQCCNFPCIQLCIQTERKKNYSQAKTLFWSCWLGHGLKMESKEKCARSPSRLCTEASTVEGLETGFSAIKGATPVCASLSWSWERKLAFNTVVPQCKREKIICSIRSWLALALCQKEKSFHWCCSPRDAKSEQASENNSDMSLWN